ncbi:MAG: tRNA lysidine(34) synthetase TilS, partial [Bacilli bacterium]|nr:tRNA lysidine(34) synthetase TilS [Bacilli bacterium]
MSSINIEEEFKFEENDSIVIGCSTGPDSMALLDMLLKIREKYNLLLVCAHVNHNVRKQSYEEKKYIEKYCLDNKICFETMTIENYGDDNFHNEARNIRYNFFEAVVMKYNAKYLMTAHHGDDLIETILMRIVRGSNLNGYSGFKKVVDLGSYKLVRPLIGFTKEELVNYDEENKVKYYIDSSNLKDKYTRNRYRKVVLPFLKSEEENVHKKFLKFSENLTLANDFIEKERDKAIKYVIENGKVNITKFNALDKFIQKEILYFLMQIYYKDDLILLNDRHIELLESLINSGRKNITVNLPNEVLAIKE